MNSSQLKIAEYYWDNGMWWCSLCRNTLKNIGLYYREDGDRIWLCHNCEPISLSDNASNIITYWDNWRIIYNISVNSRSFNSISLTKL